MACFEIQAPVARTTLAGWLVTGALFTLLVASLRAGALLLVPVVGLVIAAVFATFDRVRGALQMPGKQRAVVAQADGLVVDGTCVMAHASIVHASTVARGRGVHAVHLAARMPWNTCLVFVDSAEQGRGLIDALALSQARGTTSFAVRATWAKPASLLVMVITFAVFLLALSKENFAAAAVTFVLGFVALPRLFTLQAEVGQDGLLIRSLRRASFVPYRKIERLRKTSTGVEIGLKGAPLREFSLTERPGSADAEIAAFHDAIVAGVRVQRGAQRADDERAVLERGDRDLEVWLRDMRELGAGGYRQSAIPSARLWAIVESTAVDASAREGAALALWSNLDDAGRARLAELASRTASPRLRVALDRIRVASDESALRAALEHAEIEAR